MEREVREYREGARDANTRRNADGSIRDRLRESSDYWQGFHDARIDAFPKARLLADPTRPGGWIVRGRK